MVSPLIFFDSIAVPVPREHIYRRLGYRKSTARVSSYQHSETERYMEEALLLIQLRGAGHRLDIYRKGNRVMLPEGIIFDSQKLASFLGRSEEIVLMGATAGFEIMEAIRLDADGRNVTRGVVLDAVASEMVDAALDWIMDYFNTVLRRENKSLMNRRFSAGYGDFLLEDQRKIVHLLKLDRIGIRLTESCILVPEKSVTALTGIRPSPEGLA